MMNNAPATSVEGPFMPSSRINPATKVHRRKTMAQDSICDLLVKRLLAKTVQGNIRQ
jgi:hypothetical protein